MKDIQYKWILNANVRFISQCFPASSAAFSSPTRRDSITFKWPCRQGNKTLLITLTVIEAVIGIFIHREILLSQSSAAPILLLFANRESIIGRSLWAAVLICQPQISIYLWNLIDCLVLNLLQSWYRYLSHGWGMRIKLSIEWVCASGTLWSVSTGTIQLKCS